MINMPTIKGGITIGKNMSHADKEKFVEAVKEGNGIISDIAKQSEHVPCKEKKIIIEGKYKANIDFLWYKKDEMIPCEDMKENWKEFCTKIEEPKPEPKDEINLDLDGDGDVDEDDAKIASKVMNKVKSKKKRSKKAKK